LLKYLEQDSLCSKKPSLKWVILATFMAYLVNLLLTPTLACTELQ
jgi:hypothetical protein